MQSSRAGLSFEIMRNNIDDGPDIGPIKMILGLKTPICGMFINRYQIDTLAPLHHYIVKNDSWACGKKAYFFCVFKFWDYHLLIFN